MAHSRKIANHLLMGLRRSRGQEINHRFNRDLCRQVPTAPREQTFAGAALPAEPGRGGRSRREAGGCQVNSLSLNGLEDEVHKSSESSPGVPLRSVLAVALVCAGVILITYAATRWLVTRSLIRQAEGLAQAYLADVDHSPEEGSAGADAPDLRLIEGTLLLERLRLLGGGDYWGTGATGSCVLGAVLISVGLLLPLPRRGSDPA
jgi:hypothetical protein